VSRSKAKASLDKAKMSSSASEGLALASGDHSGDHGVPPGTISTTGGGVTPGVALLASEMGDAAPPSLLAL